MGVPALFRWLSKKYPKILSPVIEDQPQSIDGQGVPVDTSKPNPNGEEFDNLYLDMNGIVHPCSHPEDRPPPETEEEMMLAVFNYTDRVVNMVRPRKILMIAVDGVAPRAKMNQQRSRRFRSVQEAKEKDHDREELLKMLMSQNGGKLKDDAKDLTHKKTWDSNAITPGTPFMHTLALCLRYWCAYKINTDTAWEKVKVIISDASVPGEGEHKIMEFIRSQRSSPEHNPNTRHVIYGLDADLIMLGLATHEPHFRVLREDVFFQESLARTCRICGQKGHIADECRGEAKLAVGQFDEKDKVTPLKPFIWLHVSVLREYLAAELEVSRQPFRFDLERALDDWVFMCFFVGNDFLPHLPSLDIREDGIDTLIAIWRDNIPYMKGYLTKDGHVDLERAQFILDGLAKQEDSIFRRRRQVEERKHANAKRRKLEEQNRNRPQNPMSHDIGNSGHRRPSPDYGASHVDGDHLSQGLPLFAPTKGNIAKDVNALTYEIAVNRGAIYKASLANKSAAEILKGQILNRSTDNPTESNVTKAGIPPLNGMTSGEQISPTTSRKRKAESMEDDGSSILRHNTSSITDSSKRDSDEQPPDNVRLWEEGYADRYYEQKFKVDPKDIGYRNEVARCYVEGLAWVLLYYFQGCPSWTWYYPYHYAPFAADFVELDKLKIKFDKGIPFRPYEQLMGVLPAASNHTIPEVFRDLMTDKDSDILDFYPENFGLDLNGKKFAWQGVALLPFIDEKRLLKAMNKRYPLLSNDEVARNETGKDVLIISDRHPLFVDIASNFYSKRRGASKYKLIPKNSDGLAGKVERDAEFQLQSPLVYPLNNEGMPSLEENHSISVHYEMPHSTHVHKSMLLTGVKFGMPALSRADIDATKAKANHSGRSYGGTPLRGSGRGRGRGGINYGASRPNVPTAFYNTGEAPPMMAYDHRRDPFSPQSKDHNNWHPVGQGVPTSYDAKGQHHQGPQGYNSNYGHGNSKSTHGYAPPY